MGSSGNLSPQCLIVVKKGIKYSYTNKMEKEFKTFQCQDMKFRYDFVEDTVQGHCCPCKDVGESTKEQEWHLKTVQWEFSMFCFREENNNEQFKIR